jgi:hypothetical protein
MAGGGTEEKCFVDIKFADQTIKKPKYFLRNLKY